MALSPDPGGMQMPTGHSLCRLFPHDHAASLLKYNLTVHRHCSHETIWGSVLKTTAMMGGVAALGKILNRNSCSYKIWMESYFLNTNTNNGRHRKKKTGIQNCTEICNVPKSHKC